MAELPGGRAKSRPAVLLLALLLVTALAGCVGIPTSGSVQVGGLIDDDQVVPDIEFRPDGPTPGSDTVTLLNDFMEALQSPAGNYAVAQEFMTAELAGTWQPNAQTTIRRGAAEVVPGSGTDLDYEFTSGAWVDDRGRYFEATPSEQHLTYSFAKVGDEWRISAAPPGIVLTENSFNVVFRAAALYFFDPSYNYLVPDVRWVPVRNTANERAVRFLLQGPSEWLAQSVVSEFPEGTALEVGGVVISGNTATVSLSAEAAQATEVQLSRIRQQLAATLRVATVELSIGGGIASAGTASAATIDPLVDGPVLVRTADEFGHPSEDGVVPIPLLSSRVVAAGADAATVLGQRVVAFRAGGTVYATSTTADAVVPLDDRPGLLPPAIDPYGFVWTVPSDDAAAMSVHALDGTATPTFSNPLPPDSRVVSMDVSRDGTRMLLSMVNGIGLPELVVYGIIRGDDNLPVALGSSLPLLISGTPVDAAWVDESSVVALTGSGEQTTAVLYGIGGPSRVLGSLPGAVQVVGGNQGTDGIRVLDSTGAVQQLRGRNWQATGDTAVFLGVQQGRER